MVEHDCLLKEIDARDGASKYGTTDRANLRRSQERPRDVGVTRGQFCEFIPITVTPPSRRSYGVAMIAREPRRFQTI